MELTKIKIQNEAKKLQSKEVSYTQALELVAKKYGFKSYAALKAVVLDKNFANPFDIKFDLEWLENLIEKGIFKKEDKNDITALCVSNIKPQYEYEMRKVNLLKQHYNWFIKNPKTYAEKILNSMLIFYSNMTAPFENYLREKVNSDFWNLYYKDEINDFISDYKNRERVRFRFASGMHKIPFVEFNFKKQETTLYIKGRGNIDFYKKILTEKKVDVVMEFIHIKAFPFYNVSKIVLIPYLFCDEGTEITKKGVKKVSFEEGYFNM